MYYTYALKSKNRNYIYVGITDNIERRLAQHNKGYNRSTKPYIPFFVFYFETFDSRVEARKREKFLKNASGKRFLKYKLEEFISENKQ